MTQAAYKTKSCGYTYRGQEQQLTAYFLRYNTGQIENKKIVGTHKWTQTENEREREKVEVVMRETAIRRARNIFFYLLF
jgi:hypothetical protein